MSNLHHLYNAALLAGLTVVQRNRHNWAPGYVPPGRDAAVAQTSINLQLRNPYRWPVQIQARASETQLDFTILGRDAGPMAEVGGAARTSLEPVEIVKVDEHLPHGTRRIINRGRPGVRVAICVPSSMARAPPARTGVTG